MKLILKNSNTTYTIENLDDAGIRRFYFVFKDFQLPIGIDIDEGEYEYSLYDNQEHIVSNGLCVIGDYHMSEIPTYKHPNNESKQYNG